MLKTEEAAFLLLGVLVAPAKPSVGGKVPSAPVPVAEAVAMLLVEVMLTRVGFWAPQGLSSLIQLLEPLVCIIVWSSHDGERRGCNVPTSLGTGVILSAVLYALVAPFLANIEGDRLRVLGDVGADVVGAYAVVGQNVLRGVSQLRRLQMQRGYAEKCLMHGL